MKASLKKCRKEKKKIRGFFLETENKVIYGNITCEELSNRGDGMNYKENEKTKYIIEKILKKLERLNIDEQNCQEGKIIGIRQGRCNYGEYNKTLKSEKL